MPIGNTTFALYQDAGLVTEFSGLYQLQHNSDLSDNPQDFVLYLGSNEANRILEASSSPGVDDIVLSITDTLPDWEATTVYAVGDLVQPTSANGRRYRCTTAGTSDATEPTWPTGAIGSQVVDGTCVWKLDSLKHEETEVKLSLTSGGLTSAIAGGDLSLGTTLISGIPNAQEVHIRIENAVTSPGTNTGFPAISININAVEEGEV